MHGRHPSSLTNAWDDIIDGVYGLGSNAITSNPNWGIYARKLGLGQAIFESSEWSGMAAGSSIRWWPVVFALL